MSNNSPTSGTWVPVAPASRFPVDCGSAALVLGRQIAIFNYGRTEWYAVQNECPHEHQMVLSRGLTGDRGGEPKVVCPLHKNQFSLVDGRHLGGKKEMNLKSYPIRVLDGMVEVEI